MTIEEKKIIIFIVNNDNDLNCPQKRIFVDNYYIDYGFKIVNEELKYSSLKYPITVLTLKNHLPFNIVLIK